MGKTNSREIEMQINYASSVAIFPCKVQKQAFGPVESVISERSFAYEGAANSNTGIFRTNGYSLA